VIRIKLSFLTIFSYIIISHYWSSFSCSVFQWGQNEHIMSVKRDAIFGSTWTRARDQLCCLCYDNNRMCLKEAVARNFPPLVFFINQSRTRGPWLTG
jgi:hypothetical protein